MQYSMRNKQAFTLIELTIVLVIIGLLASGVMVGRTVLRQAQVMSVMVDARTYISAMEAFQKKYNSLPGDMANATTYWGAAGGTVGTNYTTDCYALGSQTSPATCNGNGDGQIGTGSVNELLRVWQHLANAGFMAGSYSGITDYNHIAGVNTPAGRIDNAMFAIIWGGTVVTAHANANAFNAVYGHRFMWGGYYPNFLPATPVLSGQEAQALDSKYDDGKPALGQIMTFKNGATWLGSAPLTCASSADVTATYSTSREMKCVMLIITGF